VLSEVASLLGKPLAPILPPWGTGLAAAGLRLAGIRIPDEMAQQLRYGRGVDNRKLKVAGAPLRYTTREALQRFAEELRVRELRQGDGQPYRYEREVEEFLRYSPSVRRRGDREAGPSAS
jgi:UDP-glucose 4-epimerase